MALKRKLNQKELLAAVTAKLATLRGSYPDLATLTNPQEREIAQWVLGQIAMLDEVRMLLNGSRRSFI